MIRAVSCGLIILIVGAGLFANPGSAQPPPQVERRLGFGFIGVGGLIVSGYSPQEFFKGMFLSPPYPSTVEFTVQDNSGTGTVFEASSTQTQWLLSEMMLTSALPDIKIVIHVAFNISSAAAWSNFESGFLTTLMASAYSSTIGAVGFDIEQSNVLTSKLPGCSGAVCFAAVWQGALQRMEADVVADGWQFNSYYPQGISGVSNTSQYYFWQSSQPWAPQLSAYSNNTVGINIGGAGLDPFPSPECDYAGNPHWTIQPFPQGYFPDPSFPNSAPCSMAWPATLPQVLQTETQIPVAFRQWVIIYAGNNGTGFCSPSGCDYAKEFLGGSGVMTTANWDNPTFRSAIYEWILTHANTYLLDGAQGPATTSTSSSTTQSVTYPTNTTSTTQTTTQTSVTSPTSLTSQTTTFSSHTVCAVCNSSTTTSGASGGSFLGDLGFALGLIYVFGFIVVASEILSRRGNE